MAIYEIVYVLPLESENQYILLWWSYSESIE
jgi:hypothetical protein